MILLSIGLSLSSCAFLFSQRIGISDSVKGILFGIPIGIMLLALIMNRGKRNHS
jgi:tetrahydromethanopterin S-methyltransferase subunit G